MENLNKEQFINKVYDFTKDNMEFKGTKPCVIDFFADWCGPCKQLTPRLLELSEEYAGKVDFYKVDTEEEYEISANFRIRSIPALLFIPMQGKPEMTVGSLPKDKLKILIDKIL